MTIMVAEKMSEQMRKADSPIKGRPFKPHHANGEGEESGIRDRSKGKHPKPKDGTKGSEKEGDALYVTRRAIL